MGRDDHHPPVSPRALHTADALQELRRCSGTPFYPVVVRAEVDSARELPQTTAA